MKQLYKCAFLLLCVFVLGVSSVSADENPIDFKQSQDAWVVWTEFVNGESQILASQWQADKWSQPSLVSSNQFGNIAPAIALDPQGNPWAVWARQSGIESTIYFSKFDGEKWSPEKALTSSNGREDVTPSIAIHSNGQAVVAWGSVLDRSSDIQVLEWNGEKWGEAYTLTAEDQLPDMVPAVSFDATGRAIVVWTSTDATFNARLAAAWRKEDGKWTSEKLVELGESEFGEDLPTLKLDGETLKLYFEDGNRFFASQWNGKGWTQKQLVDLNNSFYGLFQGLEGNPQGRAWFAWTNNKGKSNTFRYNIISHDVSFARIPQNSQKPEMKYFSQFWNKTTNQAVSLLAWMLGEEDVFASGGGGGGGNKGPFSGTKGAVGDSFVAGSPGTGWVGFWAPDVEREGVGGARAGALSARLMRRITHGTQVVVLWMGTNDIGDGRSSADVVNALISAANVGRVERGVNTVYIATLSRRNDGRAVSMDRLAEAIRANGAHPIIETFNSTNNAESNIGDGAGHFTETGASNAGAQVRRAAFPRN